MQIQKTIRVENLDSNTLNSFKDSLNFEHFCSHSDDDILLYVNVINKGYSANENIYYVGLQYKNRTFVATALRTEVKQILNNLK